MINKLKYLLFAIIFLFVLMACSSNTQTGNSSNDNKELSDELYVFNWAGYMPQEVLDTFEEEFDVRIIYDTFSSNQEMLTKLTSGTVEYDLVFPTDYFVEEMIKEDLLLELDMDNIPNFENIEDVFHERDFDPGNKFSVPYMYGSIGIAYNKEKVDTPTSWEDLWNPEYKGHVTVNSSPREVFSAALQLLNYNINQPTSDQLDEAKEKLKELDTGLLAYESQIADLLISEQAWISQAYGGTAAKAMAENPNISYVLPEEGGVLWMDNIAIPNTSTNKYTAEVFINYLLEAETSKKLSDYNPSSNPNKAAKELMNDEERNHPAAYPNIPEGAVFFETLDPETLGKINELMKEIKIE